MANEKFSEFGLSGTLTGSETLVGVQGGANVQYLTSSFPITKKVSLSSAEILALFTTPKTLVAAQGANTIIQVLGIVANYTFNTTAYDTSTDLQFSIGNWAGIITISNILANTGNKIYTVLSGTANGDPSGIINTPLRVIAPSGNPLTGNSTVNLYVTYKVVSI